MAPPLATLGMVHGRFQPFHKGHLEYVVAASERCRALLVGITNPDPGQVPSEDSSPHRHLAEANPYSYAERATMIRGALSEAGLDLRKVGIVPFPIHDPKQWHRYVPAGTTQFLRVFSEWEATKAERLRGAGFRVVELPAPALKQVSGTEVRRRLAGGGDWRELVPPSVAAFIAGDGPLIGGLTATPSTPPSREV